MARLFQILLCVLFCSILSLGNAQNRAGKYKDIEKYIPYNLSSYKRFPFKTINVKIHVIQFSKEDPRNLTLEDSIKMVRVIDKEINHIYSNLQSPTLKANKYVPEIRDSRIRFKTAEILYHIDPELISPEWLQEGDKYGAPWKVDSINLETNELWFERYNKNHFKEKPKGMDSLIVYNSNEKKSHLNFDTVYYDRPFTKIKIQQNLDSLDIKKAANILKVSTVCDKDLFNRYAINDSSALHIFIVNSFMSNDMGGCGPSPLYMKVGNWNYGDGPGTVAHEAGHCLGLYHTNTPQFDDLPIKDKLCSGCNCDSTTVSNNMMGYNWCKNYLSPKQIGFMYKEYNTNPVKIKTSTDCTYDIKRKLTITKDTDIDRNYVFGGDLILKKKKDLIITGRLSLPKGAHIYIEKKASLIINGGLINNACGETWEGIVFVKKYKKNLAKMKIVNSSKQLLIVNGGKIENVSK